MLLDREDARKLADLIGKKMAKDPEKWRAIAREVGPKTGCSSPFGVGDNLPLPGQAAHALNFMHHAVRGVRPYPENGGGGGGGEAQDNSSSADPCGYVTCAVPIDEKYTCSGSFIAPCGTDPWHEFTCCTFTCDPSPSGAFECIAFTGTGCETSFACESGAFIPENGNCPIFNWVGCEQQHVFHDCASPFHA